MFSSCFSCSNASTSSEFNPGKIAGLNRLNDIQDAVNHVAATSKACAKLAASLQADLKQTLARSDLVSNLQDARDSLGTILDYCKNTTFELKCFTKYFMKSYPKADSEAGLINPQKDHFDNEVRRRSEFAHALVTETLPLAQSAERVIDQAARQLSVIPRLSLVHAVEDLERTAELHR
jgi:uncharacterized phage infection (PIP) family protein YhgE